MKTREADKINQVKEQLRYMEEQLDALFRMAYNLRETTQGLLLVLESLAKAVDPPKEVMGKED